MPGDESVCTSSGSSCVLTVNLPFLPDLSTHTDRYTHTQTYQHTQTHMLCRRITGCCCKTHAKINRKMRNSTHCKIVTSENFILKLCTRNYVGEMTHHALVSIGTVGASPQIGEILPLCDFFLHCPVLFSRFCAGVERLDRFSRFMAQTTCFRARKCLLGVRTMGDHI